MKYLKAVTPEADVLEDYVVVSKIAELDIIVETVVEVAAKLFKAGGSRGVDAMSL